MPIDLKFLGEKLQKYRNQLQLEVEELAVRTRISTEKLTQFESGLKEPTGDEILILSDFYKCDYRFFISNEKTAPFERIETLYRMFGDSFSKEDRQAIQEFIFLCECEEFCLAELGRKKTNHFSIDLIGDNFKDHGRQAAEGFRSWLKYGQEQLTKENIFEDFRELGINVFRRKLFNSNISGLFINHPNAGKCVLVNYLDDVFRQRFTVAHEVCHSILDATDQDIVVSFSDWRKTDLVEVRANSFAGHYLVPKGFVKKIVTSNGFQNKELISKFAFQLNVNTEVLLRRLAEARVITKAEIYSLKSIIPKSKKNDPELSGDYTGRILHSIKSLLERGLSSFYVHLCHDAYREHKVSAGRLAEMLLVSENELPGVLDLFKLKLEYDG